MITPEDVKKTAELARIELDAEETRALTRDLDRILDYVAKLKEADVDGAEEFAPGAGGNVFRRDEPENFDDGAGLVSSSPHAEHGFIAVKKVIEK